MSKPFAPYYTQHEVGVLKLMLFCVFFGQLTWINHIVGHIGTTLIPPRPVDINIPALP